MDADDAELHNELQGRERIADLPISRLMMSRVDEAAEAGAEVDPVTAAILAAVVSIEELIRKG